jgi:hypothetical protein
MADQTNEELKLLLANLVELNRTTRTLSEDQADLDEKYIKLGTTLVATERDAKARGEKFATLDRDMTGRARSLAQQHLSAANQAKTFSGRMQKAAGASIELQMQVLAAEVAIGQLTKGFKTAIEITGGMAVAFGGVAKSMATGSAKFTDFAGVTDAAITGFKTLAKDIPIVGGILGATFTALGGAARVSIDMLQMTSDMFENLSKTGVLGAQGMDGVKQQADNARLSLREFERVTVSNSASLARFGGSASDGAERFGKVMGRVMDGANTELRMLGFSREQIGEATAAFLAQQTRLGGQQVKSDAQLAQGAARYAKELDALAKLTGMQREEIVKQQDAALSESRFRAKYDEMFATGREDEAKALMDFQTMVSKVAPNMAQGIRDLASGYATSDAAQEFVRMGGQSILDAIQGGGGPVDAFKQLQGLLGPQAEMARSIAMAVGDDVKVIGKYTEVSDILRAEIIDGDIKIREQQKQQIEQTAGLSEQIALGRDALDKLQKQVETLAFQGIGPAITMIQGFSSALDKGVKILNNILGLDGSKSEIWQMIGTTAGTIIGQAMGATLGSLIGGIIGAITGFMAGGPLGAAIGAALGAATGGAVGGLVGGVAGAGAGYLAGAKADRDRDASRGLNTQPPDSPAQPPAPPRMGPGFNRMPGASTVPGPVQPDGQPGAPGPVQPNSRQQPNRRPGAPTTPRRDPNGAYRGGRSDATPTAPAAPTSQALPANPADLFQFGGGVSGDRENFDRLEAQFRERLVGMATEYFQQTGQRIPFSSGYRSENSNTQVGGATRSLHLEGRAVDLSTRTVEQLRNLGLLEQYGFRQNSRSGWHISDTGFKDGGIASGPNSGYETMLHGIEAVVPLPDGKTIPVSLSNMGIGSFAKDLGSYTSSLSKTDLLPEIRNILEEELESIKAGSDTTDAAVDRVGREFRLIMTEFFNQQQSQGNLGQLLQELVNLQRGLNSTSERMLQVAQN